MTTPQIDLRTLQRSSASTADPMASSSHSGEGQRAVPRPRARWMTRVLIPAAVLLATSAILAYSARAALRPRLAVRVAAVVPKEALDSRSSDALATPGSENSPPPTATLGAVVVQAPGWIEPAPYATSVPALAEGVVKEVLVLEGERVEEGQAVVRLIDDDARLAVRAAEAMLAERTSDVERATAALATAESQVLVERTAADELRDEVTRKRDLVAIGGIAAGEFRRMEIRLSGLDAKVTTAQTLVSEARAALAQAHAARDAAVVARDEATLRLSRMEIKSPVAGVVLTRLVEPGSRINMAGKGGDSSGMLGGGGVVLRVYDPSHLQVRVDVPLSDAAKVGVGTRAVVSSEAVPDQSFTGVVSRVVHEANIQRNTVQFKVLLDQPSPTLKPEMLARVKLHGPSMPAHNPPARGSAGEDGDLGRFTLLVPASSVATTGDGKSAVWVVDSTTGSPVARRRDIDTAAASVDGFISVTSGLRLTDRIIIDPPAPPAIQDGTRLRILGEHTSDTTSAAPTTP